MSREDQIIDRLDRIERRIDAQEAPLRVEGAADFLGLSKSHIYKLTSAALIPHFKQGKRLYFRRADLREWATANRVREADEVDAEAATRVSLS